MAYVTTTQFNTQLQKIGEKTLYSSEDVSLNSKNLEKISGNLDKFNFVDLMNVLSYKNATVSLTSSLSNLVYELGTTIHGGQTLTATVVKGTSSISKVEFFKNDTSVSVIVDDVADGESFTFASGTDITANETYKVVITCEDGNTVEDILSVKFYNPYYHGVTSKTLDEITSTDITAMTKDVSAKGTKEYKYTSSNERVVIAYDKNYGLLSSILDENSFENIGSFEKKEITIGSTVYYVYIMTNGCYCSDFKYTFKF